MIFSDLREQFTYHCRVKRRSENTLSYYNTTANAFAGFLEQQRLESLEILTVHHLRDFMRGLEAKGLGPGGLHAHVRALKAIFDWAQREELLVQNPASKLERPGLPKLRLPTVTPATVSGLLLAESSSSK